MRITRFLEVGVAAATWSVLILGLSVLSLTIPFYTTALSGALDVAAGTGLRAGDAAVLGERVRAFVVDPGAAPLPATWKGLPAFGPSEISHLRDVRGVLAAARVATGIVSLVLAGYVGWCLAAHRSVRLRAGMMWGAGLTVAAVALAALTATGDFGWFFAAFHGLFFASGTWTFPADSLLIRLFPEPFWVASGAAWAGLCVLLSGVLAAAAVSLRADPADKYASRTPNNV